MQSPTKGSDMTTAIRPDVRPGTYRIDPSRSSVRFTATHVFGLKPVDGTLAVASGTLVVADPPHRSTVSVDLDAASFTTDDPRRDKDVRGTRFLAAAAHPAIGFRSTGLTRTADGWQLAGILSIRGGSAPVALSIVDGGPTVDGYRFRATTTVDRVAAGVSGGRALIGRHVRVTVECCVTSG
jgi:polyisoprenoid-binding protein YceI